jgi:hypothetical protein
MLPEVQCIVQEPSYDNSQQPSGAVTVGGNIAATMMEIRSTAIVSFLTFFAIFAWFSMLLSRGN